MKVALDSNVMIYAEGADDDARRRLALTLIAAIRASDLLIPLQALGETLKWLIIKGRLTRREAVERSTLWVVKYRAQETSTAVFEGAAELVSRHAFQVWDAVILAAAEAGGATVLFSEDMHDGFRWRGVTIVNPFTDDPAPIIRELLSKS